MSEEENKLIIIMIDYLLDFGIDGYLPCQDDDESSGEIALGAAIKLKKLLEVKP